MGKKKISLMTNGELLSYISNVVNGVTQNIQTYNSYYNNKIISFSDLVKAADESRDLKECAYAITNIYDYTLWVNRKQIIIDSLSTSKKPKRGEIWTCELGQNIGSEENKVRPVIIIQNDTGNDLSPTTIVVPISNRPNKIAVHISLRDSDYILEQGEVSQITGTILCEQIKVVSKARLGRHIATLKPDFVSKILNIKLKNSIDL